MCTGSEARVALRDFDAVVLSPLDAIGTDILDECVSILVVDHILALADGINALEKVELLSSNERRHSEVDRRLEEVALGEKGDGVGGASSVVLGEGIVEQHNELPFEMVG